MKRIACIEHASFETPGHIADWARGSGHTFTRVPVFAGSALPEAGSFDGLVVMGGPMGVHDEARHPWLAAEKRLIAAAVERQMPVLGVCLGAQLIAHVAGARVYRNRFKEIGWFDVEATREGAGHARFALPKTFRAFHWHGDTFDLPAGAVQLARSVACEQQMFVLGERVLAIQCHLEMTPAGIADMVAHAAGDLSEGPFVQARDRLAGEPVYYDAAHRLLDALLGRWIGEDDA